MLLLYQKEKILEPTIKQTCKIELSKEIMNKKIESNLKQGESRRFQGIEEEWKTKSPEKGIAFNGEVKEKQIVGWRLQKINRKEIYWDKKF